MRIVFMGTPEFAVPSLQILVEAGHSVVGVITATDKYGGRGGKKLIESPIKQYAIEQQIPVLQPKNLKSADFIKELKSLKADLQVVVAFRMLPEVVWDMPPLGTLNLHGSLLPKYRGAAPINWAIINGETETGLTTFKLRHAIDTGDLYYQSKLPIGQNETAGELHDKMMVQGAELVLKTVNDIIDNKIKAMPQVGKASHAPKIFHETCEINFDDLTENVHNFIRGLSPYPTAWTSFRGKKLKVFRSEKSEDFDRNPPGTFITDKKNYLKVATANGHILLKEVQWQGRKKMDVKSFLNGINKTSFGA